MPGFKLDPIAPGRYTPATSLPAERASVSMKFVPEDLNPLALNREVVGAKVDPAPYPTEPLLTAPIPEPIEAVDP